MVETAIYVLLGFFAATLCALISVPAISRRAFRLAELRARLLAPSSLAQARADLDALRGRHAIEVASAERRATAAVDLSAEAQVELGRRASDLFHRDTLIREMSNEIARQREENFTLTRDLRRVEAENASLQIGLHDLTLQRDTANARLADAKNEIGSQELIAARNLAVIASLNARVSELVFQLNKVRRSAEDDSERAERAIAELGSELKESRLSANTAAARLVGLEARHTSLKGEFEGLGAEALRLRERIAEIEPRLATSESERDRLARDASGDTARASERLADLQRLLALRREENERFVEKLAKATARESQLNARVHALMSARVDRESLVRSSHRGGPNMAQPSAHGDQLLRQAIIRLGRVLASGSGAIEIADSSHAEVVTFDSHDPIVAFSADDGRPVNAGRASEA